MPPIPPSPAPITYTSPDEMTRPMSTRATLTGVGQRPSMKQKASGIANAS